MSMLQRLWDALRQDRWLQIAVLAFVVLYIGFQERLAAKEQMYLASGQLNLEDGHRDFNVLDEGPFIVELPADPEVVTQTMVAQLSGRPVHVKDENGDWHIMRPVIGPSGEVEDHSDTVIAIAKLSCSEDAIPEVKDAFMQLTPSAREVMCELAEAN